MSKPLYIFNDPSIETYVNYLTNNKNSFIIGSYVYKYFIRQEDNVDDLDVVVYDNNIYTFGNEVVKTMPCEARMGTFTEYMNWDYTSLTCDRDKCRNLKVDIIGLDDFKKSVQKHGISFINSLILTNNGLQDIEGDIQRKNFVIKNLKNNRYCKFKDMRAKDIAYFKKWEQIDPKTCKKYGFYY